MICLNLKIRKCNFNMAKEIQTQNPKIDRIIRQIQDGEIKIPPLQRPFVWRSEQIIQLLESIYNEYPIGSILLWETDKELPSTRNVAGFKLPKKPESHPFYYVLDGQQRLSSLYGIFCQDRSQDSNIDKDYAIDTGIFDIEFDFETKTFISTNDKLPGKEYLDMRALFDPNEFIKKIEFLTFENRKMATDLLSRFSNYELPVVITKKRELKEVGAIFERVNNTGKKLDLFDLMVAITWSDGFHLHDQFKEIHKTLEKKHFNGIKDKILLQCLSVLISKSSTVKSITSLGQSEVQKSIHLLHESLKRTVDYLSTELSVKTIKLLPHAHQIVPLCYFFSRVTTPNSTQRKHINEWFIKTSFSNRYSASTDAHIDEDVASFENLSSGKDDVFKRIAYTVTPEQLKNTTFSRSNPFARAFVVLLASKEPKNLTNGTKVDCGEALSSFNQKEYHHIFPRSFLEKQGSWTYSDINSLCNFCILPAASNKIISDSAPSLYFAKVVPNKHIREILETNLLPTNKKLYEEDKYSDFLNARAQEIVNYIDRQIV